MSMLTFARSLLLSLSLATVAAGVAASLESQPAVAQSASCQQSCRAQWNQCRISTKGSSSCDASLHSCLQSCVPKR
jgi:hypothetical protein